MVNDLISIIIPVFNIEDYIKRCLDTVMNQSYKNLEIILIDDGSTDNSGYICDEYAKKDNRITVVHKENGGVSSARNVGLNMAKGNFIGFIDPDDYIALDMYEILHEEIQNGDFDVVECNYFWAFEDGYSKLRVGHNKVYRNYPDILHDLLTTDISHGIWNKLYKKDILKSIRFNTKFKISEDSLFLFECAKNISLKCIDKPLYFYFQRSSSVLNKPFHRGFYDRLIVCEMIKHDCNSEKLISAYNAYYLPNLLNMFQKAFLAEGFEEDCLFLRKKILDNKKQYFNFKPYKINGGYRSISKREKLYILLLWLCPRLLHFYLYIRTK